MLTLDECYDVARRVSHGMPPSDFGSTRAIKAFGETLRAELLKEIEACARIASGSDMSADCDDRGATDMETGEVPCGAEARGEVCVCAERSELAHKIAAKIRARAVS